MGMLARLGYLSKIKRTETLSDCSLMFEINKVQMVGRLAGVHFPGRAIGFKPIRSVDFKRPAGHGWFVLRLFELAEKGEKFENGFPFKFEDHIFLCSYAMAGKVESLRLNSLVSIESMLGFMKLSDEESMPVPIVTSPICVLADPVKPFGLFASPLDLPFYGRDGFEIKLNPDGKNPQKITQIGDMPAPRVRAMGSPKRPMSGEQIANAIEKSEARQVLAKQMKKQLAKQAAKVESVVKEASSQSTLFDQAPVIHAKNDPNHRPGDKGILDREIVESLVDTKNFPI